MAENMTSADVLEKLSLTENEQVTREFQASGIIPASLINAEVKKTITVMGITPSDFSKSYSSSDFDYDELKRTFGTYCKDFNDPLQADVASKALEFSAKILFELGPYIRNEKKNKGDKAVRFRFPYVRTINNTEKQLSIKTVIVSTFREATYTKITENEKMIMTFKQAGMLAMETFTKAVAFCYNIDASILMTPLCGAVFSRDTVAEMARELNVDPLTIIYTINQSTTAGGQYLPYSDINCAIASTIAATRRVQDKNVRNMMIIKIVKQYSHKHKSYDARTFTTYAKYALGGVPPGLDADTLIESFNNIQTQEVNLRAQAKAAIQSTVRVAVPVVSATMPSAPTYYGTGSTQTRPGGGIKR